MRQKPTQQNKPELNDHLDTEQRVSRIIELTKGMTNDCSRIEFEWFHQQLVALVDEALHNDGEEIYAAGQLLAENHPELSLSFFGLIESRIECQTFTHRRKPYFGVLFAIPTLLWSCYHIPTPSLKDEECEFIGKQLKKYVFPNAEHIAIGNFVFAAEQLPQNPATTYQFSQAFLTAQFKNSIVDIRTEQPPAADMMTDDRFIIGMAAIAQGEMPFSWNESPGETEQDMQSVLTEWRAVNTPLMSSLFTGCGNLVLLPFAYYEARRQTDRAIRSYSLATSFLYLNQMMALNADQLTVVSALFSENDVMEYRLSFTTEAHPHEAIFGLVWPIYENGEDGAEQSAQKVSTLLQHHGIKEHIRLNENFPLEYCEGCDAPLFPLADGELVHSGLPESVERDMRLH